MCCILASCTPKDENPNPPYPNPLPENRPEMSLAEMKTKFSGKLQEEDMFAWDLLRVAHRSENKANMLLSPLSISMAVGMTANGAQGETLNQIRQALRSENLNLDEFNSYYKNLHGNLGSVDPSAEVSVANSIWYRDGFPVKPPFIEVNEKNYRAEVNGMDFDDPNTLKTINSWVSYYTNGKIETILDEISPASVMYLLNAVYFKAPWVYKFEKELTKKNTFTNSDGSVSLVPTMHMKRRLDYTLDVSARYLSLPYGQKDAFSMVLILPREDQTIDNVLNYITYRTWNLTLHNLHKENIALSLPRFKFEDNYQLEQEILPHMGMRDAFNPEWADFTGIAEVTPEKLYISRVRHKTFIEVNEEGSEAAGATSVEIEITTNEPGEPGWEPFTVNKPFLFLIKENTTGAILFIGKVGRIEE